MVWGRLGRAFSAALAAAAFSDDAAFSASRALEAAALAALFSASSFETTLATFSTFLGAFAAAWW